MSDYLENLVAKSLNRLPVIQPRRASLFEQTHPVGGTFGDGDESRPPSNPPPPVPEAGKAKSGTTRDSARSGFHESASPVSPFPTPESFDGPPERTESEAQRLSSSLQPSPTIQTRADLSPSEFRPVARESVPAPADSPQGVAVQSMPASVEISTDKITRRSVASEISHIQTTAGPPLSPVRSRGVDETPAVTRSTPLSSSEAVSEGGPDRSIVPVEARLAVAQPPAVSDLESGKTRSTPASAPSIRVTIGRIEVRAVSPPAPPPPQPRATRPLPALTLGEYLRQRNEGKR